MNEIDEIMKLEKLEFREFINNELKFLCFYIVYCIKGERVLLWIGTAYLLYSITRIVRLAKLACRRFDLHLNDTEKKQESW